MLNREVSGTEIDLIYVDLDNIQGAYVSEPGEDPFIALNTALKDRQDPTAQLVYQALLAYHHSLPDCYRLFPIRQFYENLPTAAPAAPQVVEPEIIIFARASRRWSYPETLPERFRLIG